MNYKQLAADILKNIGGEANVAALEHCSTRLRFTLVDYSKADVERLKATKGVMGVIMAAQCQIVIGNDVIEVYDEINKMASFNGEQKDKLNAPKEKKKIGLVFMDFVIGVFQPLIPAIAGAGILKAFLSLFVLLGWMDSKSVIYSVFYYAADAALYFLPLMVAVTCATKLKVNRIVALSVVGALIIPSMTTMISGGAVLFGFEIQNIQYTYQIFPAILAVLFLAVVEKAFNKITPKAIRVFFVPMMCFIIVTPVTLLLLGPLGFNIGQILTSAILWLYNTLGWIAVAILAAVLPFMIATGMHKALVPYAVSSISTTGFEMLYMPASLAHNISESGACFAVAVKTKDSDVRATAISAGISALFGITEPALYGITLQKKKALAGVVVGNIVGGVVVGLTAVKAFVAMGPGLAGMAMFVDPDNGKNIVWAFIGFGVSLVTSFLVTLLLYNEKKSMNGIEEKRINITSNTSTGNTMDMVSPLDGELIALTEVNDEVFSAEILGKGYAVNPSKGILVSPVNGKIDKVFDTKHAMSIIAENGAEILIHVGLDTVNLKGKGFYPVVSDGASMKAGDILMNFDLEDMIKQGIDMTTMVVITNPDDYILTSEGNKQIKAGEKAMKVEVK